MIIQAGSVTMNAERSYSRTESATSMTVISKAENAIKVDISDESKSLLQQLHEGKREQESAQKEEAKEKKNNKMSMAGLTAQTERTEGGLPFSVQSEEDLELEMLRRILESLRRYQKGGKQYRVRSTKLSEQLRSLAEQRSSLSAAAGAGVKKLGAISVAGGATSETGNAVSAENGKVVSSGSRKREWKIQTVTSSFFAEHEVTEYSTKGSVCTADGREISFGISVEMSRAFVEATELYKEGSYTMVDPLVINLDTDIADVSDKKFFFDLDADGEEEEISELGSRSGYLALDKNGDGIINDGSELFGTASGNGFADLAAYDGDGNGWIDEADDIFSKLKVWVKDENGENRLLNLKEAKVGAIYLGSADTRFSMNNAETNATNAVIQKTGVYLREDGTAGTVQHVDLVL